MRYPSIAIITGTLNPNISVFRRCLNAVKVQKYQGNVRHYILDGGSRKEVLRLARSYHCRVLLFKNDADEGGNRLYPGLSHVSEDLVLILESDNIMVGTHWLTDMVLPFQEKGVFTTYSIHNDFRKSDDVLTRYFALMGSPDPTLYYLNKSDKIRMDESRYDKGQILKETKKYFVVKFTPVTQPVMGDNGFMIRTNILRKVLYKDKPFYHTDAYRELLNMGYDTVGVVKNSIIHLSRPNILGQVIRRVEVKKHFTDKMKYKRIYHVYDPSSSKDRQNLWKFVFFSLTLVQPLWVSIRGFYKIHDVAWFLHPVMSLCMTFAYGLSEIQKKLREMLF